MSLYNTQAWRGPNGLRKQQLTKEPLCRLCAQRGTVRVATIADHMTPHKEDKELFFDPDNLQSLCKSCHDSVKKEQDISGSLRGSDVNGIPLDRNHQWNT